MKNNVYDNWERLVIATLNREEYRELARAPSRGSSLSSISTHFSFNSPITDHEASSSSGIRDFSGSEDGLQLYDAMPISFIELKNATRNFRPSSIIGNGEFGPVYKGWIDPHTLTAVRPLCGIAIAIRRCNDKPKFKEWMKEVWQLHHPNLIKLIAYCDEGGNNLLVREFMSKSSLDNHLFRRDRPGLSWATRIKVAIGAARGFSFLHNAKNNVIHGNFKSSNILLDEELNAKLSDRGHAEHGRGQFDTPMVIFKVAWYNMGYAAPEYKNGGISTKKSDVYAFGVVLLELLSGRRASEDGQFLVGWAKPFLSSKRKNIQSCGH